MLDLPLPKPDNAYELGRGRFPSVPAAMSVWICLVCASLLSCAGQLCQKQATRPSRRGTAESPYTLLVGDGAVMSGLRHAAVAERPAVYSGQHRLSDAESEFRLGYPRGLGHLA